MSSEGLALPIKPVVNTTNEITTTTNVNTSRVIMANGTAAAPSLTFTDAKDAGLFYDIDTGTLKIAINGATIWSLTEDVMTTDTTETKNIYVAKTAVPAGFGINGFLHAVNDNSYGLYWRHGNNNSKDLTANAGYFFETTTTNDTTTALATLDTEYNEALDIKAYVVAVNTGATLAGSYEIRGLYKNTDAVVTRVGALVTSSITDSPWTATLAIDGLQVKLNVTGAAATTVRWKAHIVVRDTRTSVVEEE